MPRLKRRPKKHKDEAVEDSLFAIIGSFRTKEGNWSERDNWKE